MKSLLETLNRPVHIAVDEAQCNPDIVRGLCRNRVAIETRLRVSAIDGFLPDNVPLQFFCAGTGAHVSLVELSGCSDDAYEVRTIEHIVEWHKLCADDQVLLKAIVDAALKHDNLWPLESNGRTAKLAFSHFEMLAEKSHWRESKMMYPPDASVIDSTGPRIAPEVMEGTSRAASFIQYDVFLKFQSLNSLSRIASRGELFRLAIVIFRMVLLCTKVEFEKLKDYRTGRFDPAQAVALFGAVYDLAARNTKVRSGYRKLPSMNATREAASANGHEKGASSVLLVPESGRYRLEPMMADMLAQLFDHHVPPVHCSAETSGRSLKWHVARKIVIAAVCCGLKTPGDFCVALNLKKFLKNIESNRGDNTLRARHLNKWLCGQTSATVPLSIPDNMPTKEDIESGNAYVLLNANGAPYADIIVVAKGVVILFQVKESSASALSKEELYEDIAQCGMMTRAVEKFLEPEQKRSSIPRASPDKKQAKPAAKSPKRPLKPAEANSGKTQSVPRSQVAEKCGDCATNYLCDLADISIANVVFVVVCSNGFNFDLKKFEEVPEEPYINLCAKAPPGSRDFMYPLPWPLGTSRVFEECELPSLTSVVENM